MHRFRGFVLCAGIAGAVVLGACSMQMKEVYHSSDIHASVQKDAEETLLAVDVSFPSKAPALSEKAMEELTVEGVQKDYEAELSDGIYYGYHDDTMDQSPRVYIRVFTDLEELSTALDRPLVESSAAVYPQGEQNFFLVYDETQQSITVDGAWVPVSENLKGKWSLYLSFKPESSGNHIFYISDVTDETKHESYTTQQNMDTELFWDEDARKAAVCIRQKGVCYHWELEGPLDLKTVREFAETIAEIP